MLAPLALLIHTADEYFKLDPGTILRHDRSQPVASFRMVAMVVASDAGYTLAAIGRGFKRDRTTATHGVHRARHFIRKEHLWWLQSKCALYDAWQEALVAQVEGLGE